MTRQELLEAVTTVAFLVGLAAVVLAAVCNSLGYACGITGYLAVLGTETAAAIAGQASVYRQREAWDVS